MRGRKMEVAIVASFPAKRDVNVDACHIVCFATKAVRKEKGTKKRKVGRKVIVYWKVKKVIISELITFLFLCGVNVLWKR